MTITTPTENRRTFLGNCARLTVGSAAAAIGLTWLKERYSLDLYEVKKGDSLWKINAKK